MPTVRGAAGTFGWIRQDSAPAAPDAHVPLALISGTRTNARDRTSCTGLDVQRRTLMHMQPPLSSTTQGTTTPAAWDAAVPNGTYDVTLTVGDANSGADAETHALNVEARPSTWTPRPRRRPSALR